MTIISKIVLFVALSGFCFHLLPVVANEETYFDPFLRFPAKQPRIVNGLKSSPSNRPFFAKSGHDEYFFTDEILCGATLVHSDILITAAHCQGAFNSGALILDRTSNHYTRKVTIDRQKRHPGWSISRQQLNYDVLVMRLKTPLSSTDVAKPISINSDKNFPSNRQLLKAYGYGLTENNVVSDHLREADVTYISNDECWGRGITFNNVLQSNEVMCTDPFGDTTATCLGDSGGPVTDTDGTTLVGIISFGSGCEADHIPDGHVRLSEVSDWVQEQICLLSANPPDGCDSNKEPRDPRAVEVVIDFTYDFHPEDTTFSVKSKTTRETVYAGPESIPTRNGNHKESVFLLPGEYTFDVFDVKGNGLVSPIVSGNGSWKVLALYDGHTETEVAKGGPSFNNQQVTMFVISEGTISHSSENSGNADAEDTAQPSDSISSDVISNQLEKCSNEKDTEFKLFSTQCTCETNSASDDVVLTCKHGNGQACASNHQTCTAFGDCCSGRRCENGKCRDSHPMTGGREKNRLGGTSVGGAAARSARGGNLRGR